MSLLEVLEEDKKKLKELEAEEAKTEEKVLEEKLVTEEKVEEKEKSKTEESLVEAKPEESKPEEELTGARLRLKKKADLEKLREEVALRDRELVEARARIAELSKPKETVEEIAPDKTEDPAGHAEWVAKEAKKEAATAREELKEVKGWKEKQEREHAQQVLRQQAFSEIEGYEKEVRTAAPDYDQAKSYYATMIATGIKMLNPKVTNAQLSTLVENRMIARASELLNEGYENPIAAMYDEAKKWGFKPSASKETEEKELKPDLKRVAANRERNAGTAAAVGAGGAGDITLNHLAREMTVAEIAKLPKGQVEKILRQAQQGE